jgi:hypothetical protein
VEAALLIDRSQITTFAGGLLAGAGGDIEHNVTANTTATVGAGASITAGAVSITATTHADKPALGGSTPENIKGTTGGLASGRRVADPKHDQPDCHGLRRQRQRYGECAHRYGPDEIR